VRGYLDALVHACAEDGHALVSVILFGSAVRGGFSATASDVDLILVVPDGTSAGHRRRLCAAVEALAARHGVAGHAAPRAGRLATLVDRVMGTARACVVCTRADLRSGRVERILDLAPAQAPFVGRIVLASIVAPAVTVWGEELLPDVPVPPIRRRDLLVALFGSTCQLLLSAAVHPLLPGATRHAMGTLKQSLHGCYLVHHGRAASLETEIAFFRPLVGSERTLAELLALRRAYRPSLGFVLRSLPTVARLHLRTARVARFPVAVAQRA
jgi:hypothetical protein